MSKSQPKLLIIFSLGLITVLLVSCAPIEPAGTNAEPEATISETPVAPENANDRNGDLLNYATYASSLDQFTDTDVVLFFNAEWCSTCQQARGNFEASLSEIPENLAIVVVDFDDSIELRKKYGVTVQHTFVQIDGSGNAVGKWSGSVTVAEIVGQLA